MNQERLQEITSKYGTLRIAVLGDFCLDRYLEIDPAKSETSIETGLEVFNVVNVRSQPGAAGTILNNLVALGVGEILPIGFCGEDGEGFELRRALSAMPRVRLDHFFQTPERRTFTYCKPLVVTPGRPPRELNRLDSKNWSSTPETLSERVGGSFRSVAESASAVIVMDQVDVAETGVVTRVVLRALHSVASAHPELCLLADSRRGLKDYPPAWLKMNQRELAALTGNLMENLAEVGNAVSVLASRRARPVFVTLAERGISGADAKGNGGHVPAHPTRGEIDIVGAGDAVTANLTAALAAGATILEAMELAMAAASIVIHQLGTTGTAGIEQIRALLFRS